MKDTHKPAPAKAAGKIGGLILLLGMTGTALAAPEPASQARFLAHGPGYSLFLTAKEAVLVLQKPVTEADSDKAQAAVLRMTLKGANPKASITGQAPLPGKVNYLRGKNPKQWHTNIPTYARVKYDQIYPGIDLIYYGRQHQLEYDFIIEPGADPKTIHLAFTGAKGMRLDGGQLVLATATSEVRLRKPVLYQKIGGEKHLITGGYVRQGPHQVGFRVGDYNTAYSLVIDPVLSYSTYLGGSGDDFGIAIAVDPRGQAYVTGRTNSDNCPTHNALQPALAGKTDTFVAKLNRAGDALVYSTYLGGRDHDVGNGIAVNPRGQAYVTGDTFSTDFPTHNALQTTLNGRNDVFVAKLSREGDALVYSTYLGGDNWDEGFGIAVNPCGQAYVTGETSSRNFPIHNALQPIFGGDYNDAFVAKISRAGDALVYSTYLGGSNTDNGRGIAVDFRSHAYVTGHTYSADFPIQNPLQPTFGGNSHRGDAFIAKLSSQEPHSCHPDDDGDDDED